MNTKFFGLILLVLTSASLAANTKSYMNAFITETQQLVIAKNAFKKLVTDYEGFDSSVVKDAITIGEKTFTISAVDSVTSTYNTNSDDSNVSITYTKEDTALTMTYNLAASSLTVEIVFQVTITGDETSYTFTVDFTNDAYAVSSVYTADNCSATASEKTASTWTVSKKNCQNSKTSVADDVCTSLMAKFLANNLSALQTFTLSSLSTEIKAYEPYAADASGKIPARKDSSINLQFNTKCVAVPTYKESGNYKGLIYKLDGRPFLTGSEPADLTTTASEFENFFFNKSYEYQVAIPQIIIDTAYSLIYPNDVTSSFNTVTDVTVNTLRRAFPELTREYARSATFELKQKNTGLTIAEGARPVFTGVLYIVLSSTVTIDITYQYTPDIITLATVYSDDTRYLLFSIINTNGFVSGLSVSSNAQVVDQYELRYWLVNVLRVLYDQPAYKNPIADNTLASVLFDNYKSHFYYQDNYIFDLEIDSTDSTSVNGVEEEVKELLFLGN